MHILFALSSNVSMKKLDKVKLKALSSPTSTSFISSNVTYQTLSCSVVFQRPQTSTHIQARLSQAFKSDFMGLSNASLKHRDICPETMVAVLIFLLRQLELEELVTTLWISLMEVSASLEPKGMFLTELPSPLQMPWAPRAVPAHQRCLVVGGNLGTAPWSVTFRCKLKWAWSPNQPCQCPAVH